MRTHVALGTLVIGILLLFPISAVGKVASLKGQLYRQHQTVSGATVYLVTMRGVPYRGPVKTEQGGFFAFPAVDDGTYCLLATLDDTPIGSAVIVTSALNYGSQKVELTPKSDCSDQSPRATTEIAINNVPSSAPEQKHPHIEYQWSAKDSTLISSFCALCAAIVLYPLLRYLTRHWAFRRDRLFGLLEKGAIVYYYKQFRPGDEPKPQAAGDPTVQDYMSAFRKDFARWYGRKYYTAPLSMLAILVCVAVWWGARTLEVWVVDPSSLNTLRALVASALAGAFVWIISDELDRVRRRDFTVTDVYYYSFRLLLSIPFGWAITRSTVTLQVGIPLAFFLGAFPTTTLFTIARRIGSQQLKLGDDINTGTLELEALQSIGKTNAERYRDEGISTISALAYADPIDLTIRTNFDFNYVVDCVSQALTWIYFGKDSANLFVFSLRGAQEVSALVAWLSDPPHQQAAMQTLNDVAARLNISPGALRTTLAQIAEDPYTRFLVNVWS